MAAIKDPGAIVIDEVVGQWLTLVPAALEPWALNPWTVALAFCLFRLFDVVKPWPVRWADRRLKGAFGVMADDVIAAAYAAAILYTVLWLWERACCPRRSGARRVGNGGVRTGRVGGWADHF